MEKNTTGEPKPEDYWEFFLLGRSAMFSARDNSMVLKDVCLRDISIDVSPGKGTRNVRVLLEVGKIEHLDVKLTKEEFIGNSSEATELLKVLYNKVRTKEIE